MKITIRSDEIVIHQFQKEVFAANIEEFDWLFFRSDWPLVWPTIFSFLPRGQKKLYYIGIGNDKNSVTLSRFDKNFEDVLPWLEKHGWDVESGLRESLELPLIRTFLRKKVDSHDHAGTGQAGDGDGPSGPGDGNAV
jgi:hypothetical protein